MLPSPSAAAAAAVQPTVTGQQQTGEAAHNQPFTITNQQQQPPSTASASSSLALSATMRAYFGQPRIRELIEKAAHPFLNDRRSLHQLREQLEKFKATCNKGTSISLPKSLRLRIAERAQFPLVPAAPTLFTDATAALRKIEQDSEKAVYDTLVAAKERHIKHLETAIQMPLVLAAAVKVFHATVQDDAAHWQRQSSSGPPSTTAAAASSSSASSSSFSPDAALSHFTTVITERLTAIQMNEFETERARAIAEQQKAADELAAKEKVMAGAGSKETLTALANSAADAAVRRHIPVVKKRDRQASAPESPSSHYIPSDYSYPDDYDLEPRPARTNAQRRANKRAKQHEPDYDSFDNRSLDSTPAQYRTASASRHRADVYESDDEEMVHAFRDADDNEYPTIDLLQQRAEENGWTIAPARAAPAAAAARRITSDFGRGGHRHEKEARGSSDRESKRVRGGRGSRGMRR